ncbi:MAG: helix-turn-helix transcriptional regulator [Gallionella sp.]
MITFVYGPYRIPQSTISAIENGRVNLGVERAKVFAHALRCHPAVLVFPGCEVPLERAAQPCVQASQRNSLPLPSSALV